MFMFHSAFALGLIALTAGVFLYGWALQGRVGSGMGKFFGMIVILLAIVSLLCTLFSGVKMWNMRGGYAGAMCHGAMMKDNMQDQSMMNATTETTTPVTTTTPTTKKAVSNTRTHKQQ